MSGDFKSRAGNIPYAPENLQVKAGSQAPTEQVKAGGVGGLQVPDPHDALRLAGVGDVDLKEVDRLEDEQRAREEAEAEERGLTEEQREARAQAAAERAEARKRRRRVCCCDRDGCTIGPFTIVREE